MPVQVHSENIISDGLVTKGHMCCSTYMNIHKKRQEAVGAVR